MTNFEPVFTGTIKCNVLRAVIKHLSPGGKFVNTAPIMFYVDISYIIYYNSTTIPSNRT